MCSIAGDSYDSFSCTCPLGNSKCDCESSPCDSITCQNGGTCLLSNIGNPFCKCQIGYEGNRCQKDLCFPNPCKNGGYGCSHYSGGYRCICPFPRFGAFCEQFNSFALAGSPLAYYSFSAVYKSLDRTGNGHNLLPFNAESMNYPHLNDPMNEALVLFGQDIISTSSQSITLENDFSITVVFSISKFYLTTSLVIFTPNNLVDLSSMSLNILYDLFFFFLFIFLFFFFFLEKNISNELLYHLDQQGHLKLWSKEYQDLHHLIQSFH